ncbi:MAG: MaoC family dehydratase N-terminal domain-containing protein [Candidatus Rokubacteria bacterium]|nr:MaoC family dehydratase N-terminal domain-containing protein [Candidatus Rokubacteria bacterium]
METTRYFEDIGLGEVFRTPGRTVTEADLVNFAGISGDHDALDQTRGEPELPPTVPDVLVVAITSGLGFRVPVPQPQVLAFMVLEWRFLAPVRLGDTVHCRTQVTAKRGLKEGGVLVEKREVLNQRGEVVQEGEYKLLVARRPPA